MRGGICVGCWSYLLEHRLSHADLSQQSALLVSVKLLSHNPHAPREYLLSNQDGARGVTIYVHCQLTFGEWGGGGVGFCVGGGGGCSAGVRWDDVCGRGLRGKGVLSGARMWARVKCVV